LFIKNLRVEEGFFNTLDLNFSKGLNVLVGGRGVGKTTIIELLRFGLDAGNLSPLNINESSAHALSILQSSGRVSIELELNGRTINVSRSALDSESVATEAFPPPIIFSQKEVETISLNAGGRLSLIDSFIPDIKTKEKQLSSINNDLRNNSALLTQLKKEFSELREKTATLPIFKDREKQLLQQQDVLQKQNQQIQGSQETLNTIQSQLASISVDIQNLYTIKQVYEYRVSQLQPLLNQWTQPVLNTPEASPLNKLITDNLNHDSILISDSIKNNMNGISEINDTLNLLNNRKIELEVTARTSRSEVESYTEGAGAILSELGRVKQNVAQLENFNNHAIDKQNQIQIIYDKCQSNLEGISKLKEDKHFARSEIISSLNEHLLPTIGTSITPQSNLSMYGEALENSLRGSGLKYKELISKIVEKISPAWLLYYTHTLKYEDFAQTIGIPLDRATRLLGYLNEIDLGKVLTSKIEDKIDFTLLDHGNYKHVEELSIGQRCTVALSVILENPNRILVIDQPEDHLDNEYIARTLIKSISQRAEKVQTILSSHNANIPVLGNANTVINLESNGRKGFVKCQGAIDSSEIKDVIESIMEGGKQAFQTRSDFYKG